MSAHFGDCDGCREAHLRAEAERHLEDEERARWYEWERADAAFHKEHYGDLYREPEFWTVSPEERHRRLLDRLEVLVLIGVVRRYDDGDGAGGEPPTAA